MLIASALLVAALNSSGELSQAAATPVQITACSVAAGYSAITGPSYGGSPSSEIAAPGTLTISFVNETHKPVASVQFSVNYGEFTQQIVDQGIFSEGVTVRHSFDAPSNATEANCHVSSVTFADGSEWQAG